MGHTAWAPKGAKAEVKMPKGSPARSRVPEGPQTSINLYNIYPQWESANLLRRERRKHFHPLHIPPLTWVNVSSNVCQGGNHRYGILLYTHIKVKPKMSIEKLAEWGYSSHKWNDSTKPIFLQLYRVFFFTGPPSKSSKYRQINLG